MTSPLMVDDTDDDNIFSELNSDLARLDSEAEAILNSIRNETNEARSRSETSSIHDASEDAWASHEGDMHDDDEMNDEILRLGSVVASLQQDLDTMSVTTLTSTVSTLDSPAGAPPPESIGGSRADDLMEFIRAKRLYGPGVGGKVTNIPLVVVNFLLWAIVALLTIHVKHGTLDERGALPYIPTFGND